MSWGMPLSSSITTFIVPDIMPLIVPPTPLTLLCIGSNGMMKSNLCGDMQAVAQLSTRSNIESVSNGVWYLSKPPSSVMPCIAMMKGNREACLNLIRLLQFGLCRALRLCCFVFIS